jgi:DNA-binding transcriptional regulator YdaS (Cro superfamily)
MHSSLSFFVSGQAQQIFFFGLVSGAGACPAFSSETGAAVVADEVFPISEICWSSIRSVPKTGQEDQQLD